MSSKNIFKAEETIFSLSSNIVKYASSLTILIKELLQEINKFLLNMDIFVDEIKAFEIFSNAIKYSQKVETNQFSFAQKNAAITFYNEPKS
ncbi:hypothetical protein C1645_841074 [Glomus cerebriforme]|uniref:Uncharacterized protein n=1 Tax=Glomus cerebriforme TaxID=658196 RepID=A0A397S4K7_9GLOM|nr:hypothetical protein C1645_841074 [Glomus cerebriforme]